MIQRSDPRTLLSFPVLHCDFAASTKEKQQHCKTTCDIFHKELLCFLSLSSFEKIVMWRKLNDHPDKQNKGIIGR